MTTSAITIPIIPKLAFSACSRNREEIQKWGKIRTGHPNREVRRLRTRFLRLFGLSQPILDGEDYRCPAFVISVSNWSLNLHLRPLCLKLQLPPTPSLLVPLKLRTQGLSKCSGSQIPSSPLYPTRTRKGTHQPINLFLVNIAAIGSVLPSVPLMSLAAALGTGTM